MESLLQFLFSGLTVGAVYALVALGFTIIYNASDVVNFAQGEFVMLGGMITVFAHEAGVPLALAAVLAILLTAAVGVALNKLAIEPARGAPVVSVIIITIGASILSGAPLSLIFDKQLHPLPEFSRRAPIRIGGATLLPQSLWVIGGDARRVRGAVAVLHPNADRQGDARHLPQPARGAAGGHQHPARAAGFLRPVRSTRGAGGYARSRRSRFTA